MYSYYVGRAPIKTMGRVPVSENLEIWGLKSWKSEKSDFFCIGWRFSKVERAKVEKKSRTFKVRLFFCIGWALLYLLLLRSNDNHSSYPPFLSKFLPGYTVHGFMKKIDPTHTTKILWLYLRIRNPKTERPVRTGSISTGARNAKAPASVSTGGGK